jgi:hypothetical protein
MKTPIWLLDVDGVINANKPGWGAAPRSGLIPGTSTVYRMRWAPALIKRIRDLNRAGSVTIRWCSTWCSDIDQVERLFGLPHLECAWHHPIDTNSAKHAKLQSAREILARDHPLVWTDDEVVPTNGPILEELTRHGNALLIAPQTNRGLQPEHLDQIERFITECEAQRQPIL